MLQNKQTGGVVEFQGHSLNQRVGYVTVCVRRRDGTNGGGTHSSARLSLRAVTGRGESIPLISFPRVPISQIKALSLPSFVLHTV